jgi:Fe-S cluster assembly iron-binding protein IscA
VRVRITPEAVAVIRRSLELAGADPSRTAVRLRVAGGEVRPRFVTEPEPSDVEVRAGDVRVYVASSAVPEGDAEIAVTPEHHTLVIRTVG